MRKTRTKTTGAEHRNRLLLNNREKIEMTYERACNEKMEDPVILVLDLDDPFASSVAKLGGLTSDRLDACRERCRSFGITPTQIVAAPRWAVIAVVGPSTPNSLAGILKPSPPGSFRVVAIAAGGNAFADFPLPPTTS